MTIPDGFSEWEHLQDTLRLWHNRAVGNWFRNQKLNSLDTPRDALFHACRMKDADTSTMTLMRMWLFEITAGHAQSLQTPIYGIPTPDYQRDVTFKPQVKLFFQQRYTSQTNRSNRVTGEITFRLMNESAATYTRAKAVEMAKDIKREFATPIFVWSKGKNYYYYRDYDRGYDLRLLVSNKTEGEQVARAVLRIQGHPFSSSNVDYTDSDRNFPANPGTHLVYGRQVPKPIKRPIADVRFRYAQLFINGRSHVINLVATPESGLKSVIERVNSV